MFAAQFFLQPQLVSRKKVCPGNQPIKKLIKSRNLLRSEVEVLYYLQPFVRSESVPGRRCGNNNNLLTPWCRVLFEKLTCLQLVKKFPTFHGTRSFITALTSVRHLSLSWASPIQSINPHPYLCMLRDVSLRNTPPLPGRSELGSSLPPDCFVSRARIPHVGVS